MINRLNITTGYKEGRSYLKDTFFTRPFRVANIGEDRSDPSLYLMVMSSSPGILDNDHYDINIQLEPGSRLLLESQSYQRLFNMQTGAQQEMKINLSSESTFSYIQHPVVPHEQSIFKAHNIVQLADNSSFTLGEIITCGRKHSGEVFRYTKFQNLTEVFYKNKIVLKDNVLLQPQLADMMTIGQMEGFTHQATLIHINTGAQDLEEVIERTYHFLEGEEDIAFGVSQPFASCMMVRVLGNGGEQLYNAFRQIQRQLWNDAVPTMLAHKEITPVVAAVTA
ncbi:urease accessory protein UreD [Taibaiella soli]|uniref:Urease accessory protein UreD n=1 Tax=Taibaiella soli TaxID=1649169 RepID=A0A2W2B7L2_9BACT|nr:urease accessory protein UreD [Taibaiella soli]PZF72249.1 urease accessory protein UreD [Taibaiella soli]